MLNVAILQKAFSTTCGVALLALLLVSTPSEAAAQNCSRCESCSSCGMSGWGGAGCTFKSGCCSETGGNCNPDITMLDLQPAEFVELHTAEGTLTLARLDQTHYATWSCEEQSYVLYRRAENGRFVRLGTEAIPLRLANLPYLAIRELIE